MKNLIAVAIGVTAALPGMSHAVEVAGKALEIYGKAHLSVDAASAKDPTTLASVNNLSLSSNSSRLGFKGEAPVGSLTGFYTIEAAISFDNGDTTSSFAHRAAFAGLRGDAGSLLLGYRDTPYKDVRGLFDVFGDTVGDARNIVGSAPTKDGLFDKRATNAIMYTSPKFAGFEANLMYSTAWQSDSVANEAGQDNNHDNLVSLNLQYKVGGLMLAAAYEQQKHATTGASTDTGKGARLVATYTLDAMRFGAIYEKLDDDVNPAYHRSAYGANFAYRLGEGSFKLQVLKAAASSAGNDGGNEAAIGYEYKLDQHSTAYLMYSKVSNDANAKYLIGAGHDQKYLTATGQAVSAASVGFTYSF